jgi:AcrR family transcriptional regulator
MTQRASTPTVTRPWRGESAEDRRLQRRERLLEAALNAFAQHGIAKTTMRDICGGARLTERYFYESFSSTEQAFDEVYAMLKVELVQRVAEALIKAPRNIESLAHDGLHAFYTFIQEDPRRGKIMLIDAVSANRFSLERSRSAVKEYVALIESLAVELLPIGTRQKLDVEWIAWGLLGMAIQVGAIWISDGMRKSVDEVLAYNLYAWRGLQGMLMDEGANKPLSAAKTARAPRSPKPKRAGAA